MRDVFISYASANINVATELRDHLEAAGLKCWMAPRDIPAGAEYGAEFMKGLEDCRVFLLCLSEESNKSQHVAREVERAVNKKLPILTYQYKKVELTKSMEYFLASTQWYIPDNKHPYDALIQSIQTMNREPGEELEVEQTSQRPRMTKKKRIGTYAAVIITALCLFAVLLYIKPWDKTPTRHKSSGLRNGDNVTFGSMDYGDSEEELSWTVINIDKEKNTVLCLADKVIAFFPYDVAESGNRGQSSNGFYQEEDKDSYTDIEMVNFWGSSDWLTSNIRKWLNSEDATVKYLDMPPVDDGTTLYENAYDTKPGFLYTFSEEELEVMLEYDTSYVSLDGSEIEISDRVFLLSREEIELYLTKQNIKIPTTPTEGAIKNDGSNIYASYAADNNTNAFWGLRSYGDIPSCTILCAGTGMGQKDMFHSEYACSSLIGIRPVIVLPLSYFK